MAGTAGNVLLTSLLVHVVASIEILVYNTYASTVRNLFFHKVWLKMKQRLCTDFYCKKYEHNLCALTVNE